MAARTWLRAAPAEAGSVASLTRLLLSVIGRVGAMVFIGFLTGLFELVGQSAGYPREGSSNVPN